MGSRSWFRPVVPVLVALLRERGIAAEVVVRNAARDRNALAGFVREAKERKVDLVVTWGTSATRGIVGAIDAVDSASHVIGIPVVFMIVADPIGAKIVAGYDSSGRANITGTRNRVPEAVQMKAIRAFRPFNRLGLVYNRNELNSVLNADKIAALAADMGFELITHDLPLKENGKPSADDIPAALSAMKQAEVDFVYVGSSSFLMANRDRFTREALAMGLPVAGAGGGHPAHRHPDPQPQPLLLRRQHGDGAPARRLPTARRAALRRGRERCPEAHP
jgi:putative ABC transport system substrate-binding protein